MSYEIAVGIPSTLSPHHRRDAAHQLAEQFRRSDVFYYRECGKEHEQRSGINSEEQTL